ncbi:uncharacterized protein BDZ99DRAFT_274089 [Mytilinidion resinicola]|uniref:Knr4/Smi1-like domain-containing protein n=1 Tax=Mytilinidion resinicola TaxID=574789 RepID=A0A6A6YTW0_9PEZI|nr:uncharacterized protein BDZ99DRAFT_274089 [Mytilinidion resinicola]KAF2811347.1 hypothetical protein BDZ99DRAFT_274089 [Mytilinidion resinicola]
MAIPTFSPLQILQSKPYAVNSSLISLALKLALLSQIPTARRLISLLNKHSPLHHDRTTALRPLWLCWAATGAWPDGEREKAGTDEEIDAMARMWAKDWWYCDSYAVEMTNEYGFKRTLAELDDPKRPAVEDGRHVSDEGGLVRALEFRFRMQQEGTGEGVPSLEETLKERLGGYKRRLFETLAQSRLIWEAAKEGVVARAMGVDGEEMEALGRVVEETFVKRYEEGMVRPVVGSMEEMVKTIAENTQKSEKAKQEMLEPMWQEEEKTYELVTLLRDPASEDAISSLEERLGVKLPEDYKSFLRVTNGFGGFWNGTYFDSSLFPADKVRFDDDYDFMEETGLDLLDCQIDYFVDDFDAWPKLGRAIHIGREDTTMVFLLPPATVAKVRDAYLAILESEDSSEGLKKEITNAIRSFCGDAEAFKECEWCAAESMGGMDMECFPSFGAYIAEKVRIIEPEMLED